MFNTEVKEAKGVYLLQLQARLRPKGGLEDQTGRIEVVVFLAAAFFQVSLKLFSPPPA